MLEVARRYADQIECDPGILDQIIDDLYRNAGMHRPPLAAASMVLSEACCNNTVYPMGPNRGSEADHFRQWSNRDRDSATEQLDGRLWSGRHRRRLGEPPAVIPQPERSGSSLASLLIHHRHRNG